MTKLIRLISTILLLFCNPICTSASNFILTDFYSTPEISPSKYIPANIYLLEINFKNSEQDYLVFGVKTEQEQVNLKGLQFHSDKVFKTIAEDFYVESGSTITLFFDSDQEDSESELKIYTSNKGLTSTTEQITIKQGDHYFDFFCWYQDPISKSEQSEFEELALSTKWPSNDPKSCFSAKEVGKNQSLYRIDEPLNTKSWTTSQPSLSDTSDQLVDNIPALNQEDFPAIPINNSINDEQISNSTNSTDTTPLEDSPIIITEVYPAPDKTEFEWLELFNQSDLPINLENWIIDDEEGGSKPKKITAQKIMPQTYLQINLKSLKISLGNSVDSVRLFTPQNELASQVDYQEAPKKSSYQLISIDDQTEWQWNSKPTPGQPNPTLSTITATITTPASFEKVYHFEISQISNSNTDTDTNTNFSTGPTSTPSPGPTPKPIMVIFDEELIKAPLAEQIFIPGSSGKFIGEIIETLENQNYQFILKLHQYEILNQVETENYSTFIPIAVILLVTGAYFIYRNRKWIISQFHKFSSPS